MDDDANALPYLTHDLPGTGGTLKARPEDFQVEEVPLYEPCGEGTHAFLLVEKRGMATFEAVWKLAKALGRRTGEFGVAGLKDADAVTRQYLSLEHVSKAEVEALDLPGIRILDLAFHKNKLKMGHLRGNRFRILIRGTGEGGEGKARAVLERLEARGIPNFYGPQRFGLFGNTHQLGRALLKRDWKEFVDILITTPRGDAHPEYGEVIDAYRRGDFNEAHLRLGRSFKYEGQALRALLRHPGRFDRAAAAIDKAMLQFYLSAFQSHLFNRYLAGRLDRFDRLEKGDVAFLHRNGASFRVEDPDQEQPRADAFEISPSGPLFGSKMLQAEGEPGRAEAALLEEAGFELEELRGIFGIRFRGARRPLRIPLEQLAIAECADGLEVSFFLPQGAYATVLLREVMKTDEK